MFDIKNYPDYLKLIIDIENGDFSCYKKLAPIIKSTQNRISMLGELVEIMSENKNYYLSYTVGVDCVLNSKKPQYLSDDVDFKVRKYLRSLCSTTKAGETFTINFHGGLISTISCFGYRFKKQLNKLIRYHPINFVSIIDFPINTDIFEKNRWIGENLSINAWKILNFEKIKRVNFRAANIIEYDNILSDLILFNYREVIRGQYHDGSMPTNT